MTFPLTKTHRIQLVIGMLRPSYWIKNILVFAPAYLGETLFNFQTMLHCLIAFVAICALASSCYIFNDLNDQTVDALHPAKKNRAIASGKVSPGDAVALALVLFVSAFLLAWSEIPNLILPLLFYAAGSILYSLVWKKWPAVDILWLAVLHTLRLVIGGAAAGVALSHWLLAFAAMFFFSLATAKRVSELVSTLDRNLTADRSYQHNHATLLLSAGLVSGGGSVVVLILYAYHFMILPEHYTHPVFLWGVVGCLALWLVYFWRSALTGKMLGDPVGFAITNRGSILIGFASLSFMTMARL